MSEVIQKPVKIRSGDTILFNPVDIKTKDVTLIRSGGSKKLSIFNAIFNSFYSDFHLLNKSQRENIIKQNIVEIFKLDKKYWIKKYNSDYINLLTSFFQNIKNFISDSPLDDKFDEKRILHLIDSEKMVDIFFRIVSIFDIINNNNNNTPISEFKKLVILDTKSQLNSCRELSLLDSKTESSSVKNNIISFVQNILDEVENISYYNFIKQYFRSLESFTNVETISLFTKCNIIILDPISFKPLREQSFYDTNFTSTILLYKHENVERYDNIYEIIPDRIIRDFKTDSLFIQNVIKFI